jgi:hypothetical protein
MRLSFVTVTATSPGPPMVKNEKEDYNSYSPAPSRRSTLIAHDSPPSSPLGLARSACTPPRSCPPSTSASEGAHSVRESLSRTSSRLRRSPYTMSLRNQTSRDDLSDVMPVKDPRSIITDEAMQAGQPSLTNMMEALEGETSPPSSPSLPIICTEPIRLAPPIWTMTRSDRTSSTPSSPSMPIEPTHTTTVDPPTGPFGRSHDPFLVTSYASRGRLDRSRVSFPTSRAMSDNEEDADSGISLNEAEIRGLMLTPPHKPSEIEVRHVESSKPTPSMDKDMLLPEPKAETEGRLETEELVVADQIEPGSTEEVIAPDQTDSLITTLPAQPPQVRSSIVTHDNQSSLPRLLQPRLKINFAWDDMTIPSTITIVSAHGEEKEKVIAESASSAETRPQNPADLQSSRARTLSLNWATGLAYDTATGVAKYGLSYVPAPLRPRSLRA